MRWRTVSDFPLSISSHSSNSYQHEVWPIQISSGKLQRFLDGDDDDMV